MKLSEIFVYPIKGTAGMSPAESLVQPAGLEGDRRWVLVDEQGQFIQQRVCARLALVRATPLGSHAISLHAPGMPTIEIAEPSGVERVSVTVWDDTIDAADAADQAAAWFSDFLGLSCRLAFMDAATRRPVAATYGEDGDVASFADALPLLVATQTSLDDLNHRLDSALPMSRFRPNVVVDETEPWEEDRWTSLRIGDIEFQVTHACVRCVVTTIDQATAERSRNGEPLKTLATFRRQTDGGVTFGLNLLPRGRGLIRRGDPVIPSYA